MVQLSGTFASKLPPCVNKTSEDGKESLKREKNIETNFPLFFLLVLTFIFNLKIETIYFLLTADVLLNFSLETSPI